jgi:hypothetical protein
LHVFDPYRRFNISHALFSAPARSAASSAALAVPAKKAARTSSLMRNQPSKNTAVCASKFGIVATRRAPARK